MEKIRNLQLRLFVFAFLIHGFKIETSKSGKFVKMEQYMLLNSPIVVVSDLTMIPDVSIYCCIVCRNTENCKSVSVNKQGTLCNLYDVAFAALGSNPIQDSNWDSYTMENEWVTVVKYSSGSGSYNGMDSVQFWSDAAAENFTFPADDCSLNPAEKCTRPYKSVLLHEMLNSELVSQVKLSVYDDGIEAAWVTFEKAASWFQGAKVVDSFPWDTIKVKDVSTYFNWDFSPMRWVISEGLNPGGRACSTAYASWLSVYDHWCKCVTDGFALPLIMYSKTANATGLSRFDAFRIEREIGPHCGSFQDYDMNFTDTEYACDTYMHTTVAHTDNLDIAYSNGFDCCSYFWMKTTGGPRAGLLIQAGGDGCGAGGYNWASWNTNDCFAGSCKTDKAAAGVADTLVISIKLG